MSTKEEAVAGKGEEHDQLFADILEALYEYGMHPASYCMDHERVLFGTFAETDNDYRRLFAVAEMSDGELVVVRGAEGEGDKDKVVSITLPREIVAAIVSFYKRREA